MPDRTPNVLAVDDDPLNLEIIVHGLSKLGYEVTCSSDSEHALALLHNRPDDFDVILLDRQLPGMDGLSLLRKIKQHDKLKNIPIVFQTAMGKDKEIKDGIDAGAYYYLCKPFDNETLARIVDGAASDGAKEKQRQEVLKKINVFHDLVDSAALTVRTLEDADRATHYLAHLYPEPDVVSFGIYELILNGIEHGNLDIGYDRKTSLATEEEWKKEVKKRLAKKENAGKKVTVTYLRNVDEILLTIEDEGSGFDWRPYMKIDPDRVAHNHGRGIAISNMRCFDEIKYSAPGNKVTAILKLKA